MPLYVAIAFAVTLIGLLFAYTVFATYNAIVALRLRIDKAWANVDVALRQRYDELPRLVTAVRDLMRYERGVLEEVTRLRAAYSPDAPLPAQAALATATTRAVKDLLFTVEHYPQIRAQENVLDLQNEIERLESIIADRRELYNDMVALYNTRIEQVPAVFMASMFGWEKRPFFRADERSHDVPGTGVAGEV
jgi:LemA protein